MKALLALLLVMPTLAQAVTLEFPSNAVLQDEKVTSVGEYAMPTGPWTPEGMPVLIGEGEVRQQAWRVDAAGLTTLQLLEPLRDQLTDSGFDILFQCSGEACGGFDFRFATPVLPAPAMQVDLGQFRFLSAQRATDGNSELVSLLVSRTSQAGYIQLSRVGAAEGAANLTVAAGTPTRAVRGLPTGDFGAQLETVGSVVLSDLTFETGSAQLAETEFASLQKLADYLSAYPDRTVALVGHTDSVGSLEGNIALSKRRAGSVLERLVTAYDVPRRQLDAQGMGYLAPIASNLTEEGREANRRVTVIITSTE